MSKQNNVNTDFYKTGGREHTEGSDKGDVRADQNDQQAHAIHSSQGNAGGANFIPGEAPVGETGKTSAKKDDDSSNKR